LALDHQPPDLEAAAREGILKGGNHPDDVSSLIWLYLNFRHFSYLEKAIDLLDGRGCVSGRSSMTWRRTCTAAFRRTACRQRRYPALEGADFRHQ
jgi:hypothetical protein